MFANRKKSAKDADTSVIVVAAGNAARMGGIDKQFICIGGVPVLIRSLQSFEACPSIRDRKSTRLNSSH